MAGVRFEIFPVRSGGYSWRLLSANNRTVGRSRDVFGDVREAGADLVKFRSLAATARVQRLAPAIFRVTTDHHGAVLNSLHTREKCSRIMDLVRMHAGSAPVVVRGASQRSSTS